MESAITSSASSSPHGTESRPALHRPASARPPGRARTAMHNVRVGNRRVPAGVGVSAREAEVLAALAEHLTNAAIADRLFISVRTVESHVSSLLRKLQLSDRRALAAAAANLRPLARQAADGQATAPPAPGRQPPGTQAEVA